MNGTAAVPAAPGCNCLVQVPGQTFWHTHTCPNCSSSWTHIAPTPMTQGKNREIHTCTKCGTLVYEFERLEQSINPPEAPQVVWALGGLLLGLLVAHRIDRGQ